MKKRLIAVMLSGLMMVSALTGCASNSGEEETHVVSGVIHISASIKNTHIAVEQNDECVLHKGDIHFYESGSGKYATGINMTDMSFDCGKTLTTNARYSLSEEMPTEENYDRICEDCFGVD